MPKTAHARMGMPLEGAPAAHAWSPLSAHGAVTACEPRFGISAAIGHYSVIFYGSLKTLCRSRHSLGFDLQAGKQVFVSHL